MTGTAGGWPSSPAAPRGSARPELRPAFDALVSMGAQARQPEPAGEQLTASLPVGFDGTARPVEAGAIRLFAGLRSDPFFADVEGALHGFQWTGHDDFADNNVDSIVLEVPDDVLAQFPYLGPPNP